MTERNVTVRAKVYVLNFYSGFWVNGIYLYTPIRLCFLDVRFRIKLQDNFIHERLITEVRDIRDGVETYVSTLCLGFRV